MALTREWLKPNETAKELLVRVLIERPLLLLPPMLHHLPFHVGNIVEIVGPSPSAKTLILIQATIDCILPKEWNGMPYGALGRALMFVDLDCCFDVLRFSQLLKRRLIERHFLGFIKGCLKDASDVFADMLVWGHGYLSEAEELLNKMEERGISLDTQSYNFFLSTWF